MAAVIHARSQAHNTNRSVGHRKGHVDGRAEHSHTYRLPPGVTTVKFGDAATPHPGTQGHLPPLHVNSPGVIGPVMIDRQRRHVASRKIDVQLTAGDVEALIQELMTAGTSSPLNKQDVDILVANGVLTSRDRSTQNSVGALPAGYCQSEADEEPFPYPPVPATSEPMEVKAGKGVAGMEEEMGVVAEMIKLPTSSTARTPMRDLTRTCQKYRSSWAKRAKNFDDKGYLTSSVVAGEADKAGKRKKAEKQSVASQHHQQAPMFDLFTENKTLAGRKPIRVIAADLDKRIEMLKSNQAEWDAFQNKILEYREADNARARTAPADMIRLNKEAVTQLPEVTKRQRMASVKEERDRHRLEIRTRKQEHDMERWHEKVAALQKKKDVLEQMKKKEREQMGRAQALQRKWFVLTAVASRMTLIRIVLETERERRAQALVRLHAARVIQRVYRTHMRRREEARKLQALAKISVVFRRYVARRRESQKHMASDAIRQFFRDVYDVSRLMKIVKKYRFSVVKAQTYVLSWSEIRNCQIKVLSKYWDKLEPLWWNARKGGAAAASLKKGGSNADLDEKKEKLKTKKARGKVRKDDVVEKVPLKMTNTIKRNTILADLIIRRKEHRQRLSLWEQDMITFNASHKTGKGESGPPRRPVFKLLPPQSDMLILIEKGFLEAASAGWR
ncbi:hypothetical protein PhCBS80983_g01619 [Powellomyces hirtus]|uniref:Uncharacterized protein n=1 Tax=Powellomyces hirtus TaxID=109895 RepID=A0A507E9B4_9FUNG|nr:hypothetical protein PhCBS80983_g01619 [Powellomyces hirtus]